MTVSSENTAAASKDVWVDATRRALAEARCGNESRRPSTPWSRLWERFRSQRLGVLALCILIAAVLVAIFQSFVAPQDPVTQDLRAVLQGPSSRHWLGTDDLGRDVLSRLVYGTRVSLLAAVQATGIAVLLGLPFGLISGYLGGKVDRTVMFVNDAIMAMPGLLLAIAIVGMLGPGLTNAMFAIGIVFAPRILRIVRSSVMEVKEQTYIEASRSIGAPMLQIILRHILRNIRSSLIVAVSLMLGRAMLNEASLSFLGMGAQYPTASWGAMLGRAFPFVERAPYLIIFPGVVLAIVVLCFNIVGDALRDSIGRESRKGE